MRLRCTVYRRDGSKEETWWCLVCGKRERLTLLTPPAVPTRVPAKKES